MGGTLDSQAPNPSKPPALCGVVRWWRCALWSYIDQCLTVLRPPACSRFCAAPSWSLLAFMLANQSAFSQVLLKTTSGCDDSTATFPQATWYFRCLDVGLLALTKNYYFSIISDIYYFRIIIFITMDPLCFLNKFFCTRFILIVT